MSIWNIEYLNEEQVFEKPDYGVKFVIPPSSVEQGEKVTTEVKVVLPEDSQIILPPDVELVSCFYEIKTTGKFSTPIELHIQHNVEITSEEESKQLAFITAKATPPYEFDFLSIDIDQEFKPYDRYGVVKPSDFSLYGIVMTVVGFFCNRYAMTAFLRRQHTSGFSWVIQAVITKDLGPFLQVVS